MDFVTIHNGEIELNVAIKGKGPLLLCVHGFPELWYSWRHQLDHFAERGYTAAAIDVRGYGGSSRPHPSRPTRCAGSPRTWWRWRTRSAPEKRSCSGMIGAHPSPSPPRCSIL